MRICSTPDCGRKHQARGYCGSCYNRHFAKPSQALTPCTVCGTMVMKDKRDHTKRKPVCSDMCKVFLRCGHWPICDISSSRRARALAKLQASIADAGPRRRWYAGWCRRCREPFVDRRHEARWCSERCKIRAAHARRETVKRGAWVEDVSPIEIYERDGWRCQIGGCLFRSRAVARTKIGTKHPKAPTLDHIIPLAAGVEAGGVHSRANMQCAHSLCNSIKSDKAANDQLRLFG